MPAGSSTSTPPRETVTVEAELDVDAERIGTPAVGDHPGRPALQCRHYPRATHRMHRMRPCGNRFGLVALDLTDHVPRDSAGRRVWNQCRHGERPSRRPPARVILRKRDNPVSTKWRHRWAERISSRAAVRFPWVCGRLLQRPVPIAPAALPERSSMRFPALASRCAHRSFHPHHRCESAGRRVPAVTVQRRIGDGASRVDIHRGDTQFPELPQDSGPQVQSRRAGEVNVRLPGSAASTSSAIAAGTS